MSSETRPAEDVSATPEHSGMRISEMQELSNHLIQEAPRLIQEAEQFLDISFNNFDPHAEEPQGIIKNLENHLTALQETFTCYTRAMGLLEGFKGEQLDDGTKPQTALRELAAAHRKLHAVQRKNAKRIQVLVYLMKGDLKVGEALYFSKPPNKNRLLYMIKAIEGSVLKFATTDFIYDKNDQPLTFDPPIASLADLREHHREIYWVKTREDIEADMAARRVPSPRRTRRH